MHSSGREGLFVVAAHNLAMGEGGCGGNEGMTGHKQEKSWVDGVVKWLVWLFQQ